MGKCISKLHKQRYVRVSNLPGHRITGSFMLVIGLFMWVIRAPMRVTGAPIRSIELPDRLFNASSSVNYFVCKKFLGNILTKPPVHSNNIPTIFQQQQHYIHTFTQFKKVMQKYQYINIYLYIGIF